MAIAYAAATNRAIGVRGLKNLGGQIQEEYLAAIKSWSKESKLYVEMRDDPVVGTLLDAIKLPLLAADFDVTPASDSESDSRAAEFVWANMHGMTGQSWRAHIADMLESLDFGFAVGEIVLEKRDDGRLWLAGIEPRAQESLYRWEFDPQDRATAMIQQDPDTGQLLTIPLDKCLHATFGGRKGSPQGRALLRSLFRPWRVMRELENLEAIGVERDVGGMPMAELGEGVYTTTDVDNLKEALKGIRQDEEAYLIVPHGVKVAAYGGGNKLYDVGAIIERYQKLILMRMFAQFLKLGMDKVGTQALVKGSTDFFMLGLVSIQQSLLEVWQRQLVAQLFRWNRWPGLTGLPQIVWHDPGTENVAALMAAYGQGVTARVITPIREDEETVRAKLDLPDLPEGEGEGPRDIEAAPPQGLFGP